MGWVANFGEKTVDFDDLSPDTFEGIAKEEKAGANWWDVYINPGGNPDRMFRVMTACAQSAGLDAPAKPTTMREANAFAQRLTKKEDISEQPVVDGFPPEPVTPANGSTSGAPESSDGPDTKPARSRSASS